jgi:hypothetical protein
MTAGAVCFPRMLRWRHDKPIAKADTAGRAEGAAGRAGREVRPAGLVSERPTTPETTNAVLRQSP